MRTLIIKGIILLTVFFLVVTVAVFIFSQFYRNKFSFAVEKDKTVLVLGDSHTACAINDNMLTNCVNISRLGEPYMYTYTKVRNFYQANPQMKTILLSFNPESLLEDRESWIYKQFPMYFYFFSIEDFTNLIKSNTNIFFKSITNFNAPLFFSILWKKNLSFFGGYSSWGNQNQINQSDAENNVMIETDYSDLQIVYLNKTIHFCKSNNIEIYLINTPVFQRDKYIQLKKFRDFYINNYTNILLLDFSDVKLPSDCYGDVRHLNDKGAKVFTEHLLSKGLVK